MRYTISINQLALAESGKKISLEEAAVLDFLITYCTSNNEKINNKRNDGFTWINFAMILKEMPLLRCKSIASISQKIKNLEKNGFIITKYSRDKGKKYIKLTKFSMKALAGDLDVVNMEYYRQFIKIGCSPNQSRIMASTQDFLLECEEVIENTINKDRAASKVAYLWTAYKQWLSFNDEPYKDKPNGKNVHLKE